MHKNVFLTPVAGSVPFNNTTNGFVSSNTQGAIEELKNYAQQVASPGFTWGRSGNIPQRTYLLNDSVPSNTTGRMVPFTGYIEQIFIACEAPATFTLEIQKRVGNSFVVLTSITVIEERTKVITLSGVNVSALDELAAYIASGSCKNAVIGAIIKGNQ